jgi:hypothetical protein
LIKLGIAGPSQQIRIAFSSQPGARRKCNQPKSYGDTVAAIAPKIDGDAKRVIDLGGQALAPGFIDVHNHARVRRGIFAHPTADNFVRQGVTTVIEGPDGSSPVPLAPFLKQLTALPKSLKVGSLGLSEGCHCLGRCPSLFFTHPMESNRNSRSRTRTGDNGDAPDYFVVWASKNLNSCG